MTASRRFEDTGESIWDFLDHTLVVCPRCGACAHSRADGEGERVQFRPRRLTCGGCGYVDEWSGKSVAYRWWDGAPEDEHFGLPLWLQEPCCGEVLWAYNSRHLQLLEEYVGAKLRETRQHGEDGPLNSNLASRLPSWMISAKNRDRVVAVIERLKAKR